jgi:hypothetical protein
VRQNGRLFFWRREIENYKRTLAGLPPKEPDTAIDVLVAAGKIAKEFDVHRRTIGRRVAEVEKAHLALATA